MNVNQAAPPEEPFTSLLVACEEALAAGVEVPPPSAAAVPPELRERLERGRAFLRRLQQLRPSQRRAGDKTCLQERVTPDPVSPDTALAPTDMPQQLGRFQIRRELGRGGFGVVFLAYDPRLCRDVALKVPRLDALMTAELRDRFQREARAAAGLDHPNLVPVYEAGEVGPICYIASAYCPGPTLAEWLKRRTEPVPFPAAAALVATLAEAVQHAHSRGILHRDLKPANILLQTTEHTENTEKRQKNEEKEAQEKPSAFSPSPPSLSASVSSVCSVVAYTPKITDFGLAKLLGSEAGPTRQGAILGTPSYMAPEQAAGQSQGIGPAVDVYALGAILYELLTGRPPFQGETAVETLLQVKSDEPVPPARLRPRLPGDLETICLKCLHKEPARRYASAGALAEDLQRFLGGKPIAARPVGRPERLWRWGRRKPLVASLLAALLVALVGGFAGVTALWLLAAERSAEAQRERNAAVGAQARAETHFQKAREVVERLTRVGEELTYQPRMEQTRQAILEEVLLFHQGFLQEKSGHPGVRQETARASIRAGYLQEHLGRGDQAEENFRHGIDLGEKLAAEFPAEASYRHELAAWYRYLGNLLKNRFKNREAEETYRRTITLAEELLADSPAHTPYRNLLANTLMNWSIVLREQDRLEAASQANGRALQLQKQLLETSPRDPTFRQDLALSLVDQSRLLWSRGQQSEAEAACRQGLAMVQSLVADVPKGIQYQFYLARSHNHLGWILAGTGRFPEAEHVHRQAVLALDKLAADFPSVPEYRRLLAASYVDLAEIFTTTGRSPEAVQAYRQAVPLWDKLVTEFPPRLDYRRSLAQNYFKLAGLLRTSGQTQEAQQAYRRCLAVREKLAADLPEDASAQNNLAWFLVTCADPQFRDAARALQRAKRATELAPNRATYWNTLGVAHYRDGDWKAAVGALEKSVHVGSGGECADWFFLAMAHWQLGDPKQARTWYDRALQWMESNKSTAEELQRFRAEAEALLTGRGTIGPKP